MNKSKPREYTEAILSAVLIALLIRAFVIEAFKIPSASMVPTLQIGDHIFVNKFLYGLRIPFTKTRFFQFTEPKRGDVVVFLYPMDESKDYIKRVVGLPGDRVRTDGTDLYVNDEKVPRTPNGEKGETSYFEEKLGDMDHMIQFGPYRSFDNREYHVPPDSLFVMGDNRDNSADSREWGVMPMGNLKGKAMFVWLSCGEPGAPPDTSLEKGLEAVRSTIASIPLISAIFPCDGHWLSVRWNRFGKWVH